MAVDCLDLVLRFGSGPDRVEVLDGLTACVADREFVGVVGPSGCGKSTLLRLIAGILEPSAGSVRFSGGEPEQVPTAMVFQDHALLPWLDVLDNVALPLEARRIGRTHRRDRAAVIATRFGLAGFLSAYPHQLSGGMRQRAGIARALIANPSVLLMDEPFGSLDAQTRLVMQEELLQTWELDRRTVIFVTHDIEEAIRLSDRVLVLSGRPARVIADIPIEIRRPRVAGPTPDAEVADLRWRIWELLQEEARRSARA
jgi:NitT/TauT family transport system ATP-binding protein